jgi:hypothetical protein
VNPPSRLRTCESAPGALLQAGVLLRFWPSLQLGTFEVGNRQLGGLRRREAEPPNRERVSEWRHRDVHVDASPQFRHGTSVGPTPVALPVGEQIDTRHLGTRNTYAYGPDSPAAIAAHHLSDAKRRPFCYAYDDATFKRRTVAQLCRRS